MRRPTLVLVPLLVFLALAPGTAQRHSSRQASQGAPGVFDYYVLALSWSPEFCYSHRESLECQSGHRGFVVHGLWPQYVNGYPGHCSNAPGLSNPGKMADIMPDPGLAKHEWSMHGTCSGLNAEHYFQLLRRAFTSIKIPARFVAADGNFSIPPQEVKRDFLQDNPSFNGDEMTVSCGNNYLTGVSFCITKDLRPTPCRNLRDCRANIIRVPRVR